MSGIQGYFKGSNFTDHVQGRVIFSDVSVLLSVGGVGSPYSYLGGGGGVLGGVG